MEFDKDIQYVGGNNLLTKASNYKRYIFIAAAATLVAAIAGLSYTAISENDSADQAMAGLEPKNDQPLITTKNLPSTKSKIKEPEITTNNNQLAKPAENQSPAEMKFENSEITRNRELLDGLPDPVDCEGVPDFISCPEGGWSRAFEFSDGAVAAHWSGECEAPSVYLISENRENVTYLGGESILLGHEGDKAVIAFTNGACSAASVEYEPGDYHLSSDGTLELISLSGFGPGERIKNINFEDILYKCNTKISLSDGISDDDDARDDCGAESYKLDEVFYADIIPGGELEAFVNLIVDPTSKNPSNLFYLFEYETDKTDPYYRGTKEIYSSVNSRLGRLGNYLVQDLFIKEDSTGIPQLHGTVKSTHSGYGVSSKNTHESDFCAENVRFKWGKDEYGKRLLAIPTSECK